jgi:uncharacterized protein (DUF58 family)
VNNRALILVAVIFGLLLGALLLRQGDLAWMALPFLAYLGFAILRAPAADRVSLERVYATREVEIRRMRGKTLIAVHATAANKGPALERLSLQDDPRPGMQLFEGKFWKSAALRNGETASLNYSFLVERGSFMWETLRVVVSDPFGLIGLRLELPAAASAQSMPEFGRMRPFSLRTRRTLSSAGSVLARRGGNGTDFWGVREYHPGDPLRRLDWRLTARHPRQFFTKEFEQEAIADIGIILDARGKSNCRQGADSLFEHAVRAAASLSQVFLRQGNRVSLLISGEPNVKLYPGYGKVQLNRILQALAKATPTSRGSLCDLRFFPVRMFSSGSLIMVISPLATNDWWIFPPLRAYGYQVIVISPDPLDFSRQVLPADRIGRLASRLARLERQLEISRIRRLWIPVIDWPVSRPLAPLLRQALARTQIQIRR